MNFAELPKAFPTVSGVYELKRTIKFSVGSRNYRIEVYLNYMNANAPSHGRVYEEVDERWEKIPEFPWIDERDEDSAIRSALTFLEDRAEGRP